MPCPYFAEAAEAAGFLSFFLYIAVVLASINIFGGFAVTRRMLAMYNKKDKKPGAAK